jgi:c-di-GMP-specific phosphodiesterase
MRRTGLVQRREDHDEKSVLFSAFESVADAVVMVDSTNCIVAFNKAAERLWGHRREMMLGRDATASIPALLAGDGFHDGVRITRKDGCPIVASMSVSTTRADGELLRIAMIRDVIGDVGRQDELAMLSLAANETDRVVIISDAERRIIYVNSAFTDMFGYERAEVMGKTSLEVFGGRNAEPEDVIRLKRRTDAALNFHEDTIARDKFGKEIWVSLKVNPILDGTGAIKNVVSVITNVSDSKHLEALQRDTLEAVANDLPLADIMALVCRRVEALAPEVVCSIIAVDSDKKLRPLAAPSMPRSFADAIDGLECGPRTGSCGTAAYFGQTVCVEDIETDPLWSDFKHLALSLGLRACWSSPIKLRDGRVGGTFAFYYREKRGPNAWHEHIVRTCLHLCVLALERHEAKAHIARLAYYDSLTGLPNRTLLTEQIGRAIEEATATGKHPAFFFLDIDRFKDVNDTLGHAVGDQFLVEIARRLRGQLGADDIVSRLGGDEFVILLPDCLASCAAATAEALLACLKEPVLIDGLSLPVSASIGISLFPEDGTDGDTLLRHADTAMYQIKGAGRGSYCFFSPQMNQLAQDRLLLGAALRDALAQDQLYLHFQPQIRTDDGSLQGVEALARWTHPVLGDIAPARFIALAEGCGLIENIGSWAIDAACRQMRNWHDRAIGVPQVSVNLSPLHFRNKNLFTLVVETLERYRLSPHMLTLEITEGVMMDDVPACIENATALQNFGVGLSMDDFGTGYSSLSHLAKLPVTELKIDRSFMAGLEVDANSQAVVRAVIRIGQSLGLTVVAEGVETVAQRRFLQALQCDVLQGYLVSRPLAPADLERWLPVYAASFLAGEIAGAA